MQTHCGGHHHPSASHRRTNDEPTTKAKQCRRMCAMN
jgi:hypothetical protein